MKRVKEKFIPFRGSLQGIISYSFRRKCELLGKMFFEDLDPGTLKGVITERKFWSETFDRMNEIKKTS